MSNITFLKNLPEWFTSAFKNAYINFKNDNTAIYENIGERQLIYPAGINYFFPDDFEKLKILGFKKLQIWNLNEPSESHIDLGRSVAFNFPIECASDSVIYAAKNQYIKKIIDTASDRARLVTEDIAKKYPYKYGIRYNYNEDHYNNYSMEYPYLINTSVPHGGFSKTNSTRIFWTCAFESDYTYNDLVDKFQIWQ